MLRKFRKGFWVPYKDSDKYPTPEKIREAIASYCDGGTEYRFIDDHNVIINGVHYEISCRYPGWLDKGNYGIKCIKAN